MISKTGIPQLSNIVRHDLDTNTNRCNGYHRDPASLSDSRTVAGRPQCSGEVPAQSLSHGVHKSQRHWGVPPEGPPKDNHSC